MRFKEQLRDNDYKLSNVDIYYKFNSFFKKVSVTLKEWGIAYIQTVHTC